MCSHSGDLLYQFGTLGQYGLPFWDRAHDLPFMQLVLDSWAAFARTHDPNPSAMFLAACEFASTAAATRRAGAWAPMTPGSDTLRLLAWSPVQSNFIEGPQCSLLGFPLTFYNNA
jgi:hypothetical protein